MSLTKEQIIDQIEDALEKILEQDEDLSEDEIIKKITAKGFPEDLVKETVEFVFDMGAAIASESAYKANNSDKPKT